MAIGEHKSWSGGGSTASTGSTGTMSTTSGSTLLCFAASLGEFFAASNPISDNGSHTWTQIGSELNTATGRYDRLYKAVNITGRADHTVTATFQTSGAVTIYVVEIKDVSADPTITASAVVDGDGEPLESSTVSPAGACVLVGFCLANVNSGTETHTWGGSFSSGDQIESITDADNVLTGSMAAVVKESGGTYSSSVTSSQSPTAAHVYCVAVETSASGAAIPKSLGMLLRGCG